MVMSVQVFLRVDGSGDNNDNALGYDACVQGLVSAKTDSLRYVMANNKACCQLPKMLLL
jgi:hypothetical protein